MAKNYDIGFKEMFTQNFLALLRWLLPDVESVEVLKLPTELPQTIRWADLMLRVTFRRAPGATRRAAKIIIFECQCQRDKSLHKTMLLRAVLAHTQYDLRVKTIVLALSPRAVVGSDHVFGEGPDEEDLLHRVTVRRVFDECADDALQSDIAELLPLIPTMQPRDGDHEGLVRRVIERILERVVATEQRRIMVEQAAIFATLRLPAGRVNGIVAEVVRRHRYMLDPLRDFPYLRAGYRKGIAKGKAQGEAKGIAKGKAESLLQLLDGRGVPTSPELRQKILVCKDLALLDRWFQLGLTATSAADLVGAN